MIICGKGSFALASKKVPVRVAFLSILELGIYACTA